jgi:uncharacterized protein (DUF1778 family)
MATRKRKPTDKVQLKIRLPEEIRSLLEKAAKTKGVSLNQEFIDRLDKTITAEMVEHQQEVLIAYMRKLELMIEETSAGLAKVIAKIEEVHELSEGGYQELTTEISGLRSAIARGTLDPEDKR